MKKKATFSLDEEVILKLDKVSKIIKLSKSHLINEMLKDLFIQYESLIKNDFTLSDAFIYFGKKMADLGEYSKNEFNKEKDKVIK